jgi:hypothetical protein
MNIHREQIVIMISSLHPVNDPRRGFAVLEYVMLVLILAAGLYTFRSYIQRGFQGQYRRTGESFGFTRQYNPGASRECIIDTVTYEKGCFENQVLKDWTKDGKVYKGCRQAPATCIALPPAECVTYYDMCIEAAQKACTTGCDFQ